MVIKREAPNYMGLWWMLAIVISIAMPSYACAQDSVAVKSNDSLPFPIHDTRGDFLSARPNVYDFQNPPNIDDSVAYDPITKTYTVYEKVGSHYYRIPTTYTAEEFRAMEAKKGRDQLFSEKSQHT